MTKPRLETIRFDKQGCSGQRPVGSMYANEEERFWKRSYVVGFDDHTSTGILVNADHDDDAVDAAADFADEMGWEGYFLDEKDIEDDDDVLRVGNYGRPVDGSQLWIRTIPNSDVPDPR
jgi:hypothetical protein